MPHDHLGVEVSIAVTHSERYRLTTGTLLNLHMRQWRVPGDVDVTFEKLRDLTLVIREESKIQRHSLVVKMLANSLPNGNHFWIVSDCAKQNGIIVTHFSSLNQSGLMLLKQR